MVNVTTGCAEVWLIRKPTKDLISSRLTSKLEVLSKFLFHHQEEKQPINKSLKDTITAIFQYWNKGEFRHSEWTMQKENY
jgi:hypothetical protein